MKEFTEASEYTHSTMHSPASGSKPQAVQAHTFVFPHSLYNLRIERKEGGEGWRAIVRKGEMREADFCPLLEKGRRCDGRVLTNGHFRSGDGSWGGGGGRGGELHV